MEVPVVLLLLSCATDDSADAASTKPEPYASCPIDGCGGDIVGTWIVREVCPATAGGPLDEDECPGKTYGYEKIDFEGKIVFSPDGTYFADLQELQATVRIEQPGECLAEGQDCAASTQLDQQDPATYRCEEAADGACTCTWDIWNDESAADDGTWGTAGGVLYLDEADGGPYCVSADGLWMELGPAGSLPIAILLSPEGAG